MTDLNRVYGHLEHLWHLQSLLLWSYSAEEYADDFVKIWDFVMDDNKKINDFNNLYKNLYQAKKYC